jgi:cobalt-zinc-cadmium efflux system protein
LISGHGAATLAAGGDCGLSSDRHSDRQEHEDHGEHAHAHEHEHEHEREHGRDHEHAQGHAGDHAHVHRSLQRNRLLICIAVTGAVMVVELVGGVLSHSLALVSDAGHMLTDLLGLVLSYSAIALAARPATGVRSFGFYRAEILAAFANGILLMGATLYILYESVARLIHPPEVNTTGMLIVALLGLVANLACALLLLGVGRGNLNIRGAFLHMVGDALSSLGVVAAAVVIRCTGWERADPILSAVIAVLIGLYSWRLLRDSANVLLESAPRHVHDQDIAAHCRAEFPEVREIHDIHVWEITSSMYAMTAHVAVDPGTPIETVDALRARLERHVSEKFRIGHAIFQFEAVGSAEGHHAGPPVFDERPHDGEHGHHHDH